MFKQINGEYSVVRAAAKKVETNGIEFMVDTAIKFLDQPSGSSVASIIKQINKMYDIDGDAASRVIKQYIRESVGCGRLVQTKGSGLEGLFKLSHETSRQLERKLKATKATMSTAKQITEANGLNKTFAVMNAPSTPAAVNFKKVAASTPKLNGTKTKTVEKSAPVKGPTKDLEIGSKKPVSKMTVSSSPATSSTSAACKTLQLYKKEEPWISEDFDDSLGATALTSTSLCNWNGGKNNVKVKREPIDIPDAIAKNISRYQNWQCSQNGGKPIEKSYGAPSPFIIQKREIITSIVLDPSWTNR